MHQVFVNNQLNHLRCKEGNELEKEGIQLLCHVCECVYACYVRVYNNWDCSEDVVIQISQ